MRRGRPSCAQPLAPLGNGDADYDFSRLLILAMGRVPALPEKLPGNQAIVVAAFEWRMDAMDGKNLQVDAAKGEPLYRRNGFAVKKKTNSAVIGLVLVVLGSSPIFVLVARFQSSRRLG